MERWKSIIGYEGKYLISDLGRVKSLPKQMGTYIRGKKILKPQVHYDGHNLINLFSSVGKKETKRLGRLVAIHFVPNPKNLPQINHKDLDKTNDRWYNLEWATASENIKHSWDMDPHRGNSGGKPVSAINRNGKVLREFKKVREAAGFYGINRILIYRIIKGGKLLPGKKNTYLKYKNG